MECKKIENKFSITVFITNALGQEERDLLSQLIMQEIKQKVGLIVDDVFELQNADEYIMSGDTMSAKKIVKAIEECFRHRVSFKKIWT